jgi:hypothetical protein
VSDTCKIKIEDAQLLIGEMTEMSAGLRSISNRQAAEGKAAESAGFRKSAERADELIQRLTVAVHEATRIAPQTAGVPELPVPKEGDVWRHFKGDKVQVRCTALHSETKEAFVIYDHVGETWARPLRMWHEAEPKMGGRRRFEFVIGAPS